MTTKTERLDHANAILLCVSRYGRRFFYSKEHDRVAAFEFDAQGRIRIRDEYTGRSVLIVKSGRWRGFNNGGTLRALVQDLAEYVRTGKKIRNHFGPWPDWICDGDLWGYGSAAENVRAEVRQNPAFIG